MSGIAVGVDLGDVDRERRVAGDAAPGRRAGSPKTAGASSAPHLAHDRPVGLVVPVAAHRERRRVATLPSCDGVTSTGSLSPAIARPSVLSRSMAAWVSGWSALVTTTCELELGALRPFLVEELDPGHAVDRIGEAR